MPRFFRRIAEGVFDVPDLEARADELARWVRAQVAARSAPSRVVAVGFSNGANIAAAMLLRDPALLHGAVLFRAMVPFEPPEMPSLNGARILVSAGMSDPLIPVAQVEQLATLLRRAGADVTLEWQRAAHGLVASDVRVATDFLAQFGAA
jgi:predicted esterase